MKNLFGCLLAAWAACTGPAVTGQESGQPPAVNLITVNSLQDPADNQIILTDRIMTLREALLVSERNRTPDHIVFEQSLLGGLILLTRPLPPLTEGNTEVDGSNYTSSDPERGIIRIFFSSTVHLSNSAIDTFWKIASRGNHLHHLAFGGGRRTALGLYGTDATGNRISRCLFGYDPGQTIPFSDSILAYGIVTGYGARQNTLGPGNTILNCNLAGIFLMGSSSRENMVAGNQIGPVDNSTAPGNGNGIVVQGPENFIGPAEDTGVANTISGNYGTGVLIAGNAALQNMISRNSIYRNVRLGIDLSQLPGTGDGPGTDAANYPSRSPNANIPVPVINRYAYAYIPVTGRQRYLFYGSAVPNSTVEVFEADPDFYGYGEGKTFLASIQADALGAFFFELNINAGKSITATCTDTRGNTSEFSQTLQLQAATQNSILQIFSLNNVIMLPTGFTRKAGIRLNHPAPVELALTSSFSIPGIASISGSPVIEQGQSHAHYQLTGTAPGSTVVSLRLPNGAGAATASSQIIVDQPLPVTLDPATHRHDALDGPVPVRYYKFSAKAGTIFDVSVTPESDNDFDPVVYLFSQRAATLSTKNNFQESDCYLQYVLPEDGEYFVAVSDLYLRRGPEYAYHLKIWPQPVPSQGITPGFAGRRVEELDSIPGRAAPGDLNGDGVPDLVTTLPELNALQILLKKPNEKGFKPRSIYQLGFRPGAISIADFNQDGRKDILVSRPDTKQIVLILNQGQFNGPPGMMLKLAAGSGTVREFRTAGSDSEGVTADFNSDTLADYASLDSTGALLEVFINDGSGGLQSKGAQKVGTAPVAIDSGDFNADRLNDLAIADQSTTNLIILKGQGDGTFLPANLLASLASPTGLKSSDLDNDGFSDLLVCSGQTGVLRSFKALSNFGFQQYQDLPGGQQPSSLAVADINGDGFEDVSVANSGSQDIFLYQGLKQGLLQPLAVISNTGKLEELIWYSFGSSGSYFGVTADEATIKILESSYRTLDFPDTDVTLTSSTAFALANPSAADALVYFSLYDQSGQLVDDPDVENPVALTITAGHQIAFFVKDIFGTGASAYISWMRAVSLNQEIQGFFLKIASGSGLFMDGATARTEAAPRQLLPCQAGPGDEPGRVFSLVNPSSASTQFQIDCFGQDGQPQADTRSLTLAAGGRSVFSLSDLFPAVSTPCYLDISADNPFECFQYAETGEWIAASAGLPVIPPEGTSSRCYSAHFAEGRLYRSNLDLFNPGAAVANVTISGYRDDGTLLAVSTPHPIPARGFVRGDLSTLLGLDWQSADYITGYLVIEADQPGICGTITFGDRNSQVFASTIILQTEGFKRMAFSHVAHGAAGGIDYFTGLTLLNPSLVDITADITVYDENGQITGTAPVLVPAGTKTSRFLHFFVPAVTNQIKGYIVVTCREGDDTLVAFELFGNNQLNFLSAVPAQPY